MNKNNLWLQKVLTEDELNNLQDAMRRDTVIIPAIDKIMKARLLQCKPSQEMLKDSSYPYIRAAKDGAQLELTFLINLILSDTKE